MPWCHALPVNGNSWTPCCWGDGWGGRCLMATRGVLDKSRVVVVVLDYLVGFFVVVCFLKCNLAGWISFSKHHLESFGASGMTVCVFLEASKMFHIWVGLNACPCGTGQRGGECTKGREGCTPLRPVCPVEQQVSQPQQWLKQQLLVSCTWSRHRHYYWGLRLDVVSVHHAEIPPLSICDGSNIENIIDFHLFIFQTLVFLTWTVNRKLKARVAEKMSLSSCKLNLFNLCLTDLLYCVLESIQHTSDRCDVENRGFQKKSKKYSLQVNSELNERQFLCSKFESKSHLALSVGQSCALRAACQKEQVG